MRIYLCNSAMQMDPTNAYVLYLLGYEHFQKRDFEAAESCFTAATAFDERHYLSWYCSHDSIHMIQSCNEAKFHTFLRKEAHH